MESCVSIEQRVAALEATVSTVKQHELKLGKIESLLNGNGRLGIVGKLEVVWRSYVGLIGVAGMIAGWILRDLMG